MARVGGQIRDECIAALCRKPQSEIRPSQIMHRAEDIVLEMQAISGDREGIESNVTALMNNVRLCSVNATK